MKPLIHAQIYRDHFITFGGLITSKIIMRELGLANNQEHNLSFKDLKPLFSGNGSEPQIQRRLQNWLELDLKDRGVSFCPYDKKRDILITSPQPVIIEIKHNKSDPPEALDKLKGSPATITAVQQLFKYLLSSEPKIGILTDGMSFRFYYSAKKQKKIHKSHLVKELSKYAFEPYIEFSINDIIAGGSRSHYNLFLKLLMQPKYLETLVKESAKEVEHSEKSLEVTLTNELKAALNESSGEFADLIVFTAAIGAIRVLEDHGVFEQLPKTHKGKGYSEHLLSRNPFSKDLVKKSLEAFVSGRFIKIKDSEFGKISDPEGNIQFNLMDRIDRLLKNKEQIKFAKTIFETIAKCDCSNLDWNFWSVLYQINANRDDKNSRFGRYYTHPEIVSQIIEWFVHRERRATQDVKELPIYDPCVGSGNMLRTFLSFAQLLCPSAESPLEAARTLVEKRLWGSDIDLCALWICKLSLSTALATRYDYMPVPKIFYMDVFNTDGWGKITRNANQRFSIVSNPPWKRPKFQLNYAFRDFFNLPKLPKSGTEFYGSYENFKRIVTFSRKTSTQYYSDWNHYIDGQGTLEMGEKVKFRGAEESFSAWIRQNKTLIPIINTKNLTLKMVIEFFLEQLDDVETQKKKFSENFSSSAGDSPDVTLKDKSCASMFFSRMVRGIAKGSKFAIVQPDSFFVGNTEERKQHFSEIEKYFCFSKNRIPGTQKPLFSEVHTGMKFGVALGTKGVKSSGVKAVVFRTDLSENSVGKLLDDSEIETQEFQVNKSITNRGDLKMLPIFDSLVSHKMLLNWIKQKKILLGESRWHEGIHQAASRNRTDGKSFLIANGKSLKMLKSPFIFGFLNQKTFKGKYEKRSLSSSTLANQKVFQPRIFIADVNRNAPTRHSCLVTGIIPKGQAVFNSILWCSPKNISGTFKSIATKDFEAALYTICKSNHINTLALNWLGY